MATQIIERMNTINSSNPAFPEFVEGMKKTKIEDNTITLNGLLKSVKHLKKEYGEQKLAKLARDLFSELETKGLGMYVIGRKGYPSRFVWAVDSGNNPNPPGPTQSAEEKKNSNLAAIKVLDNLQSSQQLLGETLKQIQELPKGLTASEDELREVFGFSPSTIRVLTKIRILSKDGKKKDAKYDVATVLRVKALLPIFLMEQRRIRTVRKKANIATVLREYFDKRLSAPPTETPQNDDEEKETPSSQANA